MKNYSGFSNSKDGSASLGTEPVTVSFSDFVKDPTTGSHTSLKSTNRSKSKEQTKKGSLAVAKANKSNREKNVRKRDSDSICDAPSKRRKQDKQPDKARVIDLCEDVKAKVDKPRKQANKRRRSSTDIMEITVLRQATVKKSEREHSKQNICSSKQLTIPAAKEEYYPLWTEVHKPDSIGDVLLNEGSLTKLKDWLQTWKKRIEKENKRLQTQAPCLKGKKKPSHSSDSDFCLSDEESDVTFPKIFVLVGPHGCGKTAATYTCSSQLGFKVLEINASCQRNYKQVMAQLQEATQSHLVFKKNLSANISTKPDSQNTKKMAGVKNYFGPKQMNSISADSSSAKVHQASLILFDEVEAILEQDKGFWSAVQAFTEISKRPILLTTTDDAVLSNLENPYIVQRLHRVDSSKIVSHMCSIVEKEGGVLNKTDCSLAVNAFAFDIRQCICSLQFWYSVPKEKPKATIKRSNSKKNLKSQKNENFSVSCCGLTDIATAHKVTALLSKLYETCHRSTLSLLASLVNQMMTHHSSYLLLENRFQLVGCQPFSSAKSPLIINVEKDPTVSERTSLFEDSGLDVDFLSLAFNGRNKCKVYPEPAQEVSPPDTKQEDEKSTLSTEHTYKGDLKSLSNYLESVSCSDMLISSHLKEFPLSSSCSGVCRLLDGLTDEIGVKNCDPPYFTTSATLDMQSYLQLYSLHQITSKLAKPSSCPMQFHRPTKRKNSDLFHKLTCGSGLGSCHARSRSYNMDYQPALRAMCRVEERRKQAKTSRRFFHYLDDIQLYPSSGDVLTLTNQFVLRVSPKSDDVKSN